MTDLDKAKHDPARVFSRPRDILKDDTIARADKIEILRRWAYDEREMAVAEEENMQPATDPDTNNKLDEILKCLLELGVDSDQRKPPPTKQG